MTNPIPTITLTPPAGRPSWRGEVNQPLVYLGWGPRDFSKSPVAMHYDLGTTYYLLVRGEIQVTVNQENHPIKGPAICLFDPECPFAIGQTSAKPVEILVWVWRDPPLEKSLAPAAGCFVEFPLPRTALPALLTLHAQCRDEVAVADTATVQALAALHRLLDVELGRATTPQIRETKDVRWALACSWMNANLAIHSPVPALCDYLRMSAQTLHRFFKDKTQVSPGVYFRERKLEEARRLVTECGWQVKKAAFHLGYRHPNDLSRALTRKTKSPAQRRVRGN